MPRALDLTGHRFSRLRAVRYLGASKWLCECECGKAVTVSVSNLRSGSTKSCGCYRQERGRALIRTIPRGRRQHLDLSGRRFLRLVAMERVGTKNRYAMWRCQCDCGAVAVVRSSALIKGATRSCGCLQKELLDKNKKWKKQPPEYHRERRALWRKANRAKYNEYAKLRHRRHHELLTDGAVRRLIATAAGVRAQDIPASLIEAKRVHLKVKRLLKEVQS